MNVWVTLFVVCPAIVFSFGLLIVFLRKRMFRDF